ncbi:MAG: type II toxin-antitoxin system RelE/ParE family toxin [Actinomycetota bacterium]|nr:type II toxin-antitoxin system RelE/ParE family toxin [Caldisericota bacterium]MDP3630250.1 type II toxin-antitoxin system RelE/ParE family toxin [Actinomycetota bacterium]
MRVRFTPSARRELLEALAFIEQDSPVAADTMLERSVAGLAQLRNFPESGRIVPEFPDLPYREVLVNPYRFFYLITDDAVWIVAVWHERQLAEPPTA